MRRREVLEGLRFVTFSCHRRLPLMRNERICGVFVEALTGAIGRQGIQVVAWVIMPEHVHMIVRPSPLVALAQSLRGIKTCVAKRVIARWRAMGHRAAAVLERVSVNGRPRFWQTGGGFDRNIRDEEELTREIRYIHDNPVERGLVEAAEEWRWSSVRWWMGQREGEVPCVYPKGAGWERWKGYVTRRVGGATVD